MEMTMDKNEKLVVGRCRRILAYAGERAILPGEFCSCLQDPPIATRSTMEDNAFIRLYRGYNARDLASWVLHNWIFLTPDI